MYGSAPNSVDLDQCEQFRRVTYVTEHEFESTTLLSLGTRLYPHRVLSHLERAQGHKIVLWNQRILKMSPCEKKAQCHLCSKKCLESSTWYLKKVNAESKQTA
jgi:hypothetical protein